MIIIMPKKIYHLTIEHLYYLLQNDCFLTFKADGIYKSRNEFYGLIEYEQLEDGRELIFDYITDFTKKNIYDRIKEYCKLSDFNYPEFDILTSDNFEEVINNYIEFYNSKKNRVLPKLYLKISNECKLDIFKKINNYFPEINYPTDGWVITPIEVKYTAKVKPLNQMTIDLKYKNGNFFDSNNNVYCVEGYNLKNNSVYRCYFNNNKWIAREKRPDKKFSNPKYIIDIIQNQINFKMNLDMLNISNNFNAYYSHVNVKHSDDIIDFFSHIKRFNIKWLSECKDKSILDIGCGKSSSILSWREIEPKKVIGLDIDPVCIFKSNILTNSNNYLWFNLDKEWNIKSQMEHFGKIWEATQMYKMNNFLQTFDFIIFNFSIHYSTDYELLIKNLISRSVKGTILKFNWIDYNKIDIFNVSIKDTNVSVKLPWKDNIHIEPYFDYNKFTLVLKKYNWNFINQNKIIELHEKYQNWQSNLYYDTWIFN